MTTNQIESLLSIVRESMYWARRYCHGRNTYAPGSYRNMYLRLKEIYPDCLPKHDDTLEPPKGGLKGMDLEGDYLNDCND